MQKIFFSLITVLASLFSNGQADTITAQTYTWDAQSNPNTAYDSPGRRWFQFPADNGQQYQKILMLYNLKYFTNGTYSDTVVLNAGCYLFHSMDSDDDGLSFFANNGGDGKCRLVSSNGKNRYQE